MHVWPLLHADDTLWVGNGNSLIHYESDCECLLCRDELVDPKARPVVASELGFAQSFQRILRVDFPQCQTRNPQDWIRCASHPRVRACAVLLSLRWFVLVQPFCFSCSCVIAALDSVHGVSFSIMPRLRVIHLLCFFLFVLFCRQHGDCLVPFQELWRPVHARRRLPDELRT